MQIRLTLGQRPLPALGRQRAPGRRDTLRALVRTLLAITSVGLLAPLGIGLLAPVSANADDIPVAVAANFTAPMQVIAEQFARASGHRVLASYGATGQFYAQIANGAPYEILLAADEATPARTEHEGSGVAGSRFTYAIGKLVLWSADPGLVDAHGAVLSRPGAFRHLAVANPKTAPYGAAAMQALTRLGLADSMRTRLVQGESIGQTYQFAATGAAELGFVAYAQVIGNGGFASGSGWIVPADLYDPIRQDAVLLARGRDKAAAQAFLRYLRSEPARAVIRAFGYGLPAPAGVP